MIYEFEIDDIQENTPFWYVCDNIVLNQKVLDVGCATGYLGQFLKNNLDVEVVGVDYQDYHLNEAKKRNVYSDLIKLDLNSFEGELDKYTFYFDRIVLCDVLEHLNNPMEVLRKLSRFLKSDGKFLIDIPNIAHASVKYNLLINNFNYTPIGLLDETHIRFFTTNSIIKELSKNKFLIDKIEYIIFGPGQVNDQYVDYEKYPAEIIDYIENDAESAIYQIFVVFEKSDLDEDTLFKHNMAIKDLEVDLKAKKDNIVTENINNPIITLENLIQEKDSTITDLEDSIIRLNKNIEAMNRSLNEIKSSRSWRITKPIRSLNFYLRKLKK